MALSIMMPTFCRFDLTWMAEYPTLVKLGTWEPAHDEISLRVPCLQPAEDAALMAWSRSPCTGIAVVMGLRLFEALRWPSSLKRIAIARQGG
ncbi:MAG: hypothetical protein U0744_08225 [Gemmataceae bacterium]